MTVFYGLVISTFLTAIEGTIVSTAMPKIVEDLGSSHLYTWVISIYLLAIVISTPIFGKLADLYGRKLMFFIGTIIFLIGSTLSGLAQTMDQLVFYRLIQGIGAGSLATIPFTIIGDIFEFEMRAKMQAWMGSVWGVAAIVGPLTGGFIVDQISWHWIFFFNIPFGIVSLILIGIGLHEQIKKKKHSIDYGGMVTFAIAMASFLYALTELKEKNEVTLLFIVLCIISLIMIGVFLWIEMKVKEPMLPLALFKNPIISISNVAGLLLGFVLVTITFFIPLWIQGVQNLNATLSGIAVLPMSVTWTFGSLAVGKWLNRNNLSIIPLIGITIITVACIGFTLLQPDSTIAYIMVVSGVIGVGFGIAYTAFTVAVQSAVDWNQRGAAMGSHNLLRNLGQTIGISISGLWLSDELSGPALESSLISVFIMLVVISILSFLVTSLFLNKKYLRVVSR